MNKRLGIILLFSFCALIGVLAVIASSNHIVAQSPEETATPTLNYSHVLVESVFVRSGPGEHYPTIGGLFYGDKLLALERNTEADWVMVGLGDWRNRAGWIRRDLGHWVENIDALPIRDESSLTPAFVEKGETGTPFYFPTATPPGNYVLIGTTNALVRSGPGQFYPSIGYLTSGTQVNPTGRTEDSIWILIQFTPTNDEGTPDVEINFGWIAHDLVFWKDDIENLSILTEDNLTPTLTATLTRTPTPTNTPTATLTPTLTATATNTATATQTPTNTATITPSLTSTHTETATITPSQTLTQTHTPTETLTNTATVSPSTTPSLTLTLTDTPTHTLTATTMPTSSLTPTVTPSLEPTATPTHTLTATTMPTSSLTPTVTPSLEPTATPTHTKTPSLEPTITSIPTNTASPTASVTNTPVPSDTATITDEPETTLEIVIPATLMETDAPTDTNTPGPPSDTPTSDTTSITGIVPPHADTTNNTNSTDIPPEALVGGGIIFIVLTYIGFYFRGSANTDRYKKGFIIQDCPVCQKGGLHVESRPSRFLGIPRAKRTIKCDSCRSLLREIGNRRWRYAVDPLENQAMYTRYNGKELDEPTLKRLVQNGNFSGDTESPSFVDGE